MPSSLDVVSENIIFIDYMNMPENYFSKNFGMLSDDMLKELHNIALSYELPLLAQISDKNYTVFNRDQCSKALEELKVIDKKHDLSFCNLLFDAFLCVIKSNNDLYFVSDF